MLISPSFKIEEIENEINTLADIIKKLVLFDVDMNATDEETVAKILHFNFYNERIVALQDIREQLIKDREQTTQIDLIKYIKLNLERFNLIDTKAFPDLFGDVADKFKDVLSQNEHAMLCNFFIAPYNHYLSVECQVFDGLTKEWIKNIKLRVYTTVKQYKLIDDYEVEDDGED